MIIENLTIDKQTVDSNKKNLLVRDRINISKSKLLNNINSSSSPKSKKYSPIVPISSLYPSNQQQQQLQQQQQQYNCNEKNTITFDSSLLNDTSSDSEDENDSDSDDSDEGIH